MRYKQAIKIGSNVTDIMRLPCVFSCHKDADGGLCYLLYVWTNNRIYAIPGDWLCESHDGVWHVLSDEEYEKQKDNPSWNM